MTTQYTSILKLALPVQGELSGTWGDVVNDNITSMVEEAIAGRAVIDSWTTNSHTLTSANGTTSESRCAMLEFTDTGTALSGDATVICPTAAKIYICKNDAGQKVTIKTSAGTGVAIADGQTMFVFCDGTNVVEAVTSMSSLKLGTAVTSIEVTSILDEDDLVSDSATALATQQSIKAYVDAQVTAQDLDFGGDSGTGSVDLDSQSLTIAGTSNEIETSAAGQTLTIGLPDAVTVTTSVTTPTVQVTDVKANDGTAAVSIADTTGQTTITDAVLTTADINAGTIDNTTIGATTASTGAFTTVTSSGNTTVSGTLITDTIAEETATAGVTVDGVLLKDGGATFTSAIDVAGEVQATSLDINGIARIDSTTDTPLVVDGSATGPVYFQLVNNATAANNNGGVIEIRALSSTQERQVALIDAYFSDITDASRDSVLEFQTVTNGTSSNAAIFASENIIFNEAGLDKDFRVESDSQSHAFFIDASESRIGMGTGSPSDDLHINSSGQTTLRLSSDTDASYIIGEFSGATDGDSLMRMLGYQATTFYGTVDVRRRVSQEGQIVLRFRTNSANRDMHIFDGVASVFNEDSQDTDFRVESNNNAYMLFVNAGDDTLNIGTGTSHQWAGVQLNANNKWLTVNSNVGNGGVLAQPPVPTSGNGLALGWNGSNGNGESNIVSAHSSGLGGGLDFTDYDSDTDTYTSMLELRDTYAVFNEDSNDMDFRVESNTQSHAFFVEGGGKFITFGQSGQDATLGTKTVVQINGTDSTGVGPELLIHNPGQGGDARSMLSFGNKASSVEGYSANIYTTNNDGLFFATSVASSGFSEGTKRFNIADDGNISFYEDTGINARMVWYAAEETLEIGAIETGTNAPLSVKTNGSGHAISIEENSGAETWQIGVDSAGDLNFWNSGQAVTPAHSFLDDFSVVFNEQGQSTGDFRVESDNKTHMLFIDASLDAVQIGSNMSQSQGALDVGFSVNSDTTNVVTIMRGVSGGNTSGATSMGFPYLTIGSSEYVSGGHYRGIGFGYWIPNNGYASSRPPAEIAYYDESTSGGTKGSLVFGTRDTINGNDVPVERLRIHADGKVTINDTGTDSDFRVESDGKTHMLFVDANTNTVKFGRETISGASGQTGVSIDTNGRIISNVDNDWNFEVYGAQTGRFRIFSSAGGGTQVGSITASTSSTSYNTSSDYRLKENVVELTGATARLKQLEPKRFNFIADADTTVDGFLAHEVQPVVPEAITGTHNEVDADGNPVYQGIDQSKLVPLLVATIKELEARITALENA